MASGGHRIQGEHYHNQDIHLTVACLRARKSQLSPRDAYYQQVQPERCLLNPLDRKLHGMPKINESSPCSSKYNNVKCSIQEDKRELKRRLQYVQRCEADAEIERQKRAEKWRQLVMKEEKEERERKRNIESLQKLIKREMQRAHPRYHTDVYSSHSSTHIPTSHKDSKKIPRCPSATDITESKVAADALCNEQEASDTFEQPERMSHAIPSPADLQEACNNDVEKLLPLHRKVHVELKEADAMKKSTTKQPTVETNSKEQTAPTDHVDRVANDNAAAIDKVELATTAEVQDAALVLTEDDESKTDHCPTESEDSAVNRDYAEQLHTVLPDSEASTHEQLSIIEPPVKDTVAALITQPAAHKSGATPTVLQLTTELQIQHTDDAVITHPEATPTVELTTDVTETQQCYSTKELQTQDTDVASVVSMTQPTATQDSESTIQFTTDSDTKSGPYDTKFWYHLCNTDGINKTPESMSTVFICCHSEYSCVILYLLLYS